MTSRRMRNGVLSVLAQLIGIVWCLPFCCALLEQPLHTIRSLYDGGPPLWLGSTIVLGKLGPIRMDNLSLTDQIWAYNTKVNRLVLSDIEAIQSRWVPQFAYTRVTFESPAHVQCTASFPAQELVWTWQSQWNKTASQLSPSETLCGSHLNEKWRVVNVTSFTKQANLLFGLTVATYHNFYVVADKSEFMCDSILVHNQPGPRASSRVRKRPERFVDTDAGRYPQSKKSKIAERNPLSGGPREKMVQYLMNAGEIAPGGKVDASIPLLALPDKNGKLKRFRGNSVFNGKNVQLGHKDTAFKCLATWRSAPQSQGGGSHLSGAEWNAVQNCRKNFQLEEASANQSQGNQNKGLSKKDCFARAQKVEKDFRAGNC